MSVISTPTTVVGSVSRRQALTGLGTVVMGGFLARNIPAQAAPAERPQSPLLPGVRLETGQDGRLLLSAPLRSLEAEELIRLSCYGEPVEIHGTRFAQGGMMFYCADGEKRTGLILAPVNGPVYLLTAEDWQRGYAHAIGIRDDTPATVAEAKLAARRACDTITDRDERGRAIDAACAWMPTEEAAREFLAA